MLGGGMRQAGILAAAGIYALENNVQRLAEDHANAKRLAEGLNGTPGIHLEEEVPPTNMIYFRTDALAESLITAMEAHGVIASTVSAYRIRLVTHLDVDAQDIERTIEVIKDVATACH
jgi:threonine aldolase